MQQKAVFKLHLHDDKDKKKALSVVSGFLGIDSVVTNMKDQKLTVTGEFDPIHLVKKLRKKLFDTLIESVGPAKEEKKADDGNKKGEDDKNSSGGGQVVPYPYPIPHQYPAYMYQNYPPRPAPHMYYCRPYSVEEDPNSCVIC